ncbi:MAG: hypothetical protein AAF957_14690 [Planctomycetota bacterium]
MTAPSQEEVQVLLDRLCVDLGFCLPPAEHQQLVEDPPVDPIEFTNEVFRREGLSVEEAGLTMYRQVRDLVAEAFGQGG